MGAGCGVGADRTHLCQLFVNRDSLKAPLQTHKEPGAAGLGSSPQQRELQDVAWSPVVRAAKPITKESQRTYAISDGSASVHHCQMASASPPHSQTNYTWRHK